MAVTAAKAKNQGVLFEDHNRVADQHAKRTFVRIEELLAQAYGRRGEKKNSFVTHGELDALGLSATSQASGGNTSNVIYTSDSYWKKSGNTIYADTPNRVGIGTPTAQRTAHFVESANAVTGVRVDNPSLGTAAQSELYVVTDQTAAKTMSFGLCGTYHSAPSWGYVLAGAGVTGIALGYVQGPSASMIIKKDFPVSFYLDRIYLDPSHTYVTGSAETGGIKHTGSAIWYYHTIDAAWKQLVDTSASGLWSAHANGLYYTDGVKGIAVGTTPSTEYCGYFYAAIASQNKVGVDAYLVPGHTSNNAYFQYGVWSSVNPNAAAGITASGYHIGASMGAYCLDATGTKTGTVGTLIGARVQFGINSGPGTVTEAYGVRIYPFHTSGTITSSYGIYIGAATTGGTVTNQWALYSEHSAASYFAGAMGIGTNAPGDMLVVKKDQDDGTSPYAYTRIVAENAHADGLVEIKARGADENHIIAFGCGNTTSSIPNWGWILAGPGLTSGLGIGYVRGSSASLIIAQSTSLVTFARDVIALGTDSWGATALTGGLKHDGSNLSWYNGSAWKTVGEALWLSHANGVYYSSGNVGIGSTPAAAYGLYVLSSGTGAGSTYLAGTYISCAGGVSITSSSSGYYGIWVNTTGVSLNSAADRIVAVTGFAQLNSANTASSTVNDLISCRFFYGTNSSCTNATVTRATGIDLTPLARSGGSVSITTVYGIYLRSPSSVTATVGAWYGMYQEYASAKNYFAGATGVGKVPTDMLEVYKSQAAMTRVVVENPNTAGEAEFKVRTASENYIMTIGLGGTAHATYPSWGWILAGSSVTGIGFGYVRGGSASMLVKPSEIVVNSSVPFNVDSSITCVGTVRSNAGFNCNGTAGLGGSSGTTLSINTASTPYLTITIKGGIVTAFTYSATP